MVFLEGQFDQRLKITVADAMLPTGKAACQLKA